MSVTTDNNQFNKISLKPRFHIERPEDVTVITKKSKDEFAQGGSKFSGKIVDQHIIIDVPTEEAHF